MASTRYKFLQDSSFGEIALESYWGKYKASTTVRTAQYNNNQKLQTTPRNTQVQLKNRMDNLINTTKMNESSGDDCSFDAADLSNHPLFTEDIELVALDGEDQDTKDHSFLTELSDDTAPPSSMDRSQDEIEVGPVSEDEEDSVTTSSDSEINLDEDIVTDDDSLIFEMPSVSSTKQSSNATHTNDRSFVSTMSEKFVVSPERTDAQASTDRDASFDGFLLGTTKDVVFSDDDAIDNPFRNEGTTPYAQLCMDLDQRTLVTMLEVDVLEPKRDGVGERRRRSRLRLDAFNDDFPWLNQDSSQKNRSFDKMETKSDGTSDSSVSGNDDGGKEPIILSGWMMYDEEMSMSDEEADVHWLLNDGKDVWVKIDDGCAKVLKTVWTSCSQWKLKRIKLIPNRSMNDETPDARDEKRFRFHAL